MLRAVLVGLLSLSAVNCKSHDEGVKSQVGVAAGSVIKVDGTVTLHHGDATRPLAKGDTVEGDDVVETGADGSVVIELAHNHVTWEFGANKKTKVRESLAWGQPVKELNAKAVDEDSAAAGRHAERSAADTSVSAGAPPAAEVEKQERDDSVADKEDSKPEKAVAEKKADKKSETTRRETALAPKAEPPPTGTASKEAIQTPHAPPPPPKIIAKAAGPNLQPPPAPPPGGGAVKAEEGISSIGSMGRGGGGGDATSAGASVDDSSSFETAALDVIGKKQTELNACAAGQPAAVNVSIRIDASGKATAVFDANTPAALKSCVTKVIQKLSFQHHAVTAKIVVWDKGKVQLKP